MRTKIILMILLTTGIGLGSCKKFLNPETPSQFTDVYIYSTVSDASKAVNSIYALFNTDAFTSRLSNSFANNTDIENGGVANAPDLGRRDIWSFEATPGVGDLQTVWNNAYNAINRANECIEGIQKSSLYAAGSAEMKQLLGEAITLRAYWYQQLTSYWGDVPFKITPTKAGDSFYLPKTDRNIILTHIINDLKKAETDMGWADQVEFGTERINRDFVQGFIARLALYRGGYSLRPDMTMKREADYLDYYKIAAEYCKKLMAERPRQLPSDYTKTFRDACQYIKSNEVLYEVAFSPGFGDVGWCVGANVTAGKHLFGSTTNFLTFPLSYYHSFDTLDKRIEATFSLVAHAGNSVDTKIQQNPVAFNGLSCDKWSRIYMGNKARGEASAKGTGINWPLMRYADVLLMMAEAENEINGAPTAACKEALTTVRRRAFPANVWPEKVDAYVAAASGKDAFFNAIVNERGWEFGGEFLRRFDLIRWNLYGKKVAETKIALTKIADDALAGTGTIPDYLYYKRNSDGSITWLNKFSKPGIVPPVVDVPTKGDNPTGYLRAKWSLGISDDRTTNLNNGGGYISWQWRGYKDATGNTPVRYMLPIHSGVITASLGVLKNEGYGF